MRAGRWLLCGHFAQEHEVVAKRFFSDLALRIEERQLHLGDRAVVGDSAAGFLAEDPRALEANIRAEISALAEIERLLVPLRGIQDVKRFRKPQGSLARDLGQLALLLRARYLVDVLQLDKVQGRPFKVSEIHDRIRELVR